MDDHREGIQADKPVPPWERPGCFRSDCEPHRAALLGVMGIASVWAGGLAIFLPFSCLMADSAYGFLVTVLAVQILGPLLSLTTWFTAKSDLTKMQQGRMDRGGEKRVTVAKRNGLVGLVLSVCSGAFWAASLLAASLMSV